MCRRIARCRVTRVEQEQEPVRARACDQGAADHAAQPGPERAQDAVAVVMPDAGVHAVKAGDVERQRHAGPAVRRPRQRMFEGAPERAVVRQPGEGVAPPGPDRIER